MTAETDGLPNTAPSNPIPAEDRKAEKRITMFGLRKVAVIGGIGAAAVIAMSAPAAPPSLTAGAGVTTPLAAPYTVEDKPNPHQTPVTLLSSPSKGEFQWEPAAIIVGSVALIVSVTGTTVYVARRRPRGHHHAES